MAGPGCPGVQGDCMARPRVCRQGRVKPGTEDTEKGSADRQEGKDGRGR